MQKMTKRRFNDRIAELNKEFSDTNGDGLKQHEEIQKMLDDLPAGTEILTKYDDDRPPSKFVKNSDGSFYSTVHGTYSSETAAWDFISVDENSWAKVTKIPMSQEELNSVYEGWNKTYWRNNEQVWGSDGAFTEKASVKLWKQDLDALGDGFQVTLADGTVCEKWGDTWLDTTHGGEIKDKRRLGSPSFEGDFFSVNLGLNGVSAEQCDEIRKVYSSMPKSLQAAYEQAFRSKQVAFTYEGCAHFNPRDGKVYLTKGADEETVIHEMAHAFDKSFSKEVPDKYSSGTHTVDSASQYIDYQLDHDDFRYDFRTAMEMVGIPTDPDGGFSKELSDEQRVSKYIEFTQAYRDDPDFSCVSDVISGLTGDSLAESIYGGHSTSYWMRPFGGKNASPQSSEMWAEYCTLKAHKNDAMLDLMSKVSPKRYQACEKAYREMIENEQSDN